MGKLSEVLNEARNKEVGIVAPLVFSVEGIRKLIVHSHELQQPLILRIDPSMMDVRDVLYWKETYEKNYPLAQVCVMVQGIRSFEEAIRTGTMAVDGISLDGDLQDIKEIKDIHDVLRGADIMLERTMHMEQVKQANELYADIICMDDLFVNDQSIRNIEQQIRFIKERKDTFFAITDFTVSKENYRIIKQWGISKYDVFASASESSMRALDNFMAEGYDSSDRFLMFRMIDCILEPYCTSVKEKMYQVGPFILR